MKMDTLSDRQKMLLTLVIHEYTRTALPVGSQSLVEHYHLDLSSATVRNELAALEDMGYLRHRTPTAGRSPTEDGYRYFVSQLLQQTDMPAETRRTISHQFYQMRNDSGPVMRPGCICVGESIPRMCHRSQLRGLRMPFSNTLN
jgi:heat-inducible transcriptional repressor